MRLFSLKKSTFLCELVSLSLLTSPAWAISITVKNLNDSGPGSLREAMMTANVVPGSTISFAPGLKGTLTLSSALPAITTNMHLVGPMDETRHPLIAIDGKGVHQTFFASKGTVNLSNFIVVHTPAPKDSTGNPQRSGLLGIGNALFANSGSNVTVENIHLLKKDPVPGAAEPINAPISPDGSPFGSGPNFGNSYLNNWISSRSGAPITSPLFVYSGSTLVVRNRGLIPSPHGEDLFLMSGASLIFDLSEDLVVHSNISGDGMQQGGGVIKTGNAALVLTGNNTYLGGTIVEHGRLIINGTTQGTCLINPGGILAGNGTIGSTTNSGRVAPGNSIGILTIAGNYIQNSGSVLEMEIDGAGNSDLLNVTGSATIQPGSTLEIVPLRGAYTSGSLYTLMTAASVTGEFGQVTSTNSRISPSLIYNSDSIQLLVNTVSFADLVHSTNGNAIARAFDAADPAPGSDLEQVIAALDNLGVNVSALALAFDEMQPSQFGALALAQENDSVHVRNSLTHRAELLYAGKCLRCPQEEKKAFIWFEPYGDFTRQEKRQSEVGFSTGTGGIVLGGDYECAKNLRAGLAAAYTYTDLHWKQHAGEAKIQSAYGSAYTNWSNDLFYCDASFTAAWNHYHVDRKISFPGVKATAKNNHNGYQLSPSLGLGVMFRHKRTQANPFARFDYVYTHQNDYSEHGADSLDLKIDSKNNQLLRSELGVNFSHCFSYTTWKFVPLLKLSWVIENRFGPGDLHASFKEIDSSFSVKTFNPHRSMFAPGASLNFLVIRTNLGAVSITSYYEAEIENKYWDQTVGVKIGFTF